VNFQYLQVIENVLFETNFGNICKHLVSQSFRVTNIQESYQRFQESMQSNWFHKYRIYYVLGLIGALRKVSKQSKKITKHSIGATRPLTVFGRPLTV
jgi:hypothetical protein